MKLCKRRRSTPLAFCRPSAAFVVLVVIVGLGGLSFALALALALDGAWG